MLVLLISASVSTLASITITASTTLTMDFLQAKLFKQMAQEKAGLLAKAVAAAFIAVSFLIANTETPILDMMSYSWGVISGSFMAPYLISLYWKKLSRAGAWAGMLGGFLTACPPVVCKLFFPDASTAFGKIADLGPHFACLAMLVSLLLCLLGVARQAGRRDGQRLLRTAGGRAGKERLMNDVKINIWNPEMECMSRRDTEALQLERLKALVDYCDRNVAFYHKRLSEAGVTADKIKTLSDVQYIPYTTKADLRDTYPFGMFSVPQKQLVRIHASSGTTGNPTVVGYTREDMDNWSEQVARAGRRRRRDRRDGRANLFRLRDVHRRARPALRAGKNRRDGRPHLVGQYGQAVEIYARLPNRRDCGHPLLLSLPCRSRA